MWPKHDLGALPLRAVVLGKQTRIGGHVVVEKQENFAGRFSCAPIPSARGALIRLLDDVQGERPSRPLKGFGRPVPRSIHHHDDLERVVERLPDERCDGFDH
jgi:hypothetical protein